MGPESLSLAHGLGAARSLLRRLACVLPALAAGLLAGSVLAEEAPAPRTRESGLTEEQRVHRVQLDVSVIDPRGNRWASVPGLPRDAFKVRVDGVEITEQVEFDEICDRAGPAAPAVYGEVPTILVLADLNFLDIGMRFGVRQAIEDLADMAETRPVRVKVIAFARRLMPLMPEFSGNPQEIRRAAAALTEIIVPGPRKSPSVSDSTASLLEERNPERPAELTTREREGIGRENPPDPERARPALRIVSGVKESADFNQTLMQPRLSPLFELAQRDVDPRPSLDAIEAVMLSHGAIRGRKALVLFSSSWFDMPEDLWMSYLRGPEIAAQAGFTIWSVDARGLAGLGSSSAHHSRLLGQIATSSGGEVIRSAGRLAVGFERAISQLSCYYLFSVPVEPPRRGVKHYDVDVRLDTARYPDFWRYRVRAETGFSLLDPVTVRQRLRLAALMEPQGYGFPEIRVTAGYVSGPAEFEIPVEVSVLLYDLTFLSNPLDDSMRAEFSWEGVVTSEKGRDVCLLGDGRRRAVLTDSPPLEKPPTQLVLRSRCALPGPGLYEVRVVLEDLISGDVGAGTAFVEVAAPSGDLASVSAIRLGRNSGRDFLLELPIDTAVEVPRDRDRRSFTPLRPDEALVPGERLILRYVTCNMERPVRVVLYRRKPAANGGRGVDRADSVFEPLFQVLTEPISRLTTEDGSCSEFEGAVPEGTLSAGAHGLAFFDPGTVVGSGMELDQMIAAGHAAAFIEFAVERPAAPETPTPGQVARRASGLSGAVDSVATRRRALR